MATDYKFQGWLGLNPDSAKGEMAWGEYEPKPFEETDVDIRITHCGMCGSDLHTLRSGWGATVYPVCVGHEIVGHAVRVGSQVDGIKVGDRVGVGAQCGSCLNKNGDCEACADGQEQYCSTPTHSYDSRWPDGSLSYGGYADYFRGHSRFVIKIPDAIPSDEAAPMLCGGVTVYSPLSQNGAGPGKRIGIIGIGGLGHFGIMAAKALGCEHIIAISRTSVKKEDALAMGATGFIATDEEEDWATKHSRSLDLIVSTVSSPKMPLQGYLALLRYRGRYVQVGAPEDICPGFSMFDIMPKKATLGGSVIGSPSEIREMLALFAEKGVHTWNVNVPMKDANKTLRDFEAGKARYRFVLVNAKHL